MTVKLINVPIQSHCIHSLDLLTWKRKGCVPSMTVIAQTVQSVSCLQGLLSDTLTLICNRHPLFDIRCKCTKCGGPSNDGLVFILRTRFPYKVILWPRPLTLKNKRHSQLGMRSTCSKFDSSMCILYTRFSY